MISVYRIANKQTGHSVYDELKDIDESAYTLFLSDYYQLSMPLPVTKIFEAYDNDGDGYWHELYISHSSGIAFVRDGYFVASISGPDLTVDNLAKLYNFVFYAEDLGDGLYEYDGFKFGKNKELTLGGPGRPQLIQDLIDYAENKYNDAKDFYKNIFSPKNMWLGLSIYSGFKTISGKGIFRKALYGSVTAYSFKKVFDASSNTEENKFIETKPSISIISSKRKELPAKQPTLNLDENPIRTRSKKSRII